MYEIYSRTSLNENAIRCYAASVAKEIYQPANYSIVADALGVISNQSECNVRYCGWFLAKRRRSAWQGRIEMDLSGFSESSANIYIFFLSVKGKLLYSRETHIEKRYYYDDRERVEEKDTIVVSEMREPEILMFDAPKKVKEDQNGNYDDLGVDWQNVQYPKKGMGIEMALNQLVNDRDKYSFKDKSGKVNSEYNIIYGNNYGNVGGSHNVVASSRGEDNGV